jgi:hypothetical protein
LDGPGTLGFTEASGSVVELGSVSGVVVPLVAPLFTGEHEAASSEMTSVNTINLVRFFVSMSPSFFPAFTSARGNPAFPLFSGYSKI